MNDTLRNYKKAVEREAAMMRLRQKEDYVGAGIRLVVSVGANAPPEKEITLDLGLSTDVGGLLSHIHAAAYNSLSFWRKRLEEDYAAIAKELGK